MGPSEANQAAVTSYTVGWIAALPHERAAGTAMLDERHNAPKDFVKNQSDDNQYTRGLMGLHHVVIASLPVGEYGTNVAAITARSMLASLPHIRIGLLVGIAAGIPRLDAGYDIRLGDVVVSQPKGSSGGVIQYDLLQAEHEMMPSTIPLILENLRTRYPHMVKPNRGQPGYVHQGHEHDCYYVDGHLVEREPRDSTCPEIYYGIVASGNVLVKDAKERESILARLESSEHVLCFEMEAAGLMNNFPCLVIRGVCDYADEFKNDRWQKYAAATAAAFAREYLDYVDVQETRDSPAIGKLAEKVDQEFRSHVRNDTGMLLDHVSQAKWTEVLNWLCAVDYGVQCRDMLALRHQDTGAWFLESDVFAVWAASDKDALLCPGIPGAGKTIMATSVVEFSRENLAPDEPVLFMCFTYKRQEVQNLEHVLGTLLRQLTDVQSAVSKTVQSFFDQHKKKQSSPTSRDLQATLDACLKRFQGAVIVLDALDECRESTRVAILSAIESLREQHRTRLLVTSRPTIDMQRMPLLSDANTLEVRASDEDTKEYITRRLPELSVFEDVSQDLRDQIVLKITEAAARAFLLARLAMDAIQHCVTLAQIRTTLRLLPSKHAAYDKAYDAAMERIGEQDTEESVLAKRTLSWIIYALRPLLASELSQALAIEPGFSEPTVEQMPSTRMILSVCAGLVVVDQESNIIGLVHFTTQEYFQRTGKRWFPDAELLIARSSTAYLMLHNVAQEVMRYKSELETRRNRFDQLQAEVIDFLKHNSAVASANVYVDGPPESIPSWTRGHTPKGTHWAARCGMGSVFRELDSRHWHDRDSNGMSPLSWAASNGDAAMVELLLTIKEDIDINPIDLHGRTPIAWAAEKGHSAVVSLLLADERKGHEDVLKLLLTCPKEVGARYKHGRTPLSWAAQGGQTAIVQLLLAQWPIKKDGGDNYRTSVLAYAARAGHEEVVRLLIANGGVSKDSQNRDGRTPLSWAAEGGHTAILELLLTHWVDVNSKDCDGRTPLSFAAEQGHAASVQLLLANDKVDVNSRDQTRRTPLSFAAENGHAPVVQLLATKDKIDINSQDKERRTPLSLAAGNGHEAIVRLLLATEKVNVYHSYNSDQNPLLMATMKGHTAVVKLLLESGKIDLKWIDASGMPLISLAIWWAEREGYEQTSLYLRSI
ncbi:hypothetical protein FH972_024709 [Carpinus fangiana]|uniref:Uncharacterized protein n=1 Tax=Carpinus fangiana TaxID=176857 RepID=A0A5N6KYS5_9ROSI|nr:hypothetical protein FH972_024709 [Carpinus fangiana]